MRKTLAIRILVCLMISTAGTTVLPAGASPKSSTDRITVSDLRHSVVPAYCTMPRQRLHHNKTARKYLPAQGWMNLQRPGQPIFTHLRPGRPVLVATYQCTAGGVGWPQVVVAYSPKGRLLDALYLDDYAHQEHADVTRWSAVGHSVRTRWISYEGAGFHKHRHNSRITLNQGQLVLHPMK